MTRLNLALFFVLIACALAAVTAQNQARKLFVDLQKEQEVARKLDVEWGQLQLEQSTWATHSRIEAIASDKLHMSLPTPSQVRVVGAPAAGASQP